jgi:hypothetical protein
MVSSGMLRRVALVRTDVSEEPSASFIRVAKIGKLGTTLAVTSNRRKMRRNTKSVTPNRRFLQKPHGVTFQKTPFFFAGLSDCCGRAMGCWLFHSGLCASPRDVTCWLPFLSSRRYNQQRLRFVYFSTLKMELIWSAETLINFEQTR